MLAPLLVLALSTLALAAGCASTPARGTEPTDGVRGSALWVLAPHPDDEALFGAEILQQALADRRPFRVVLLTNGDLGCERDGHERQRETLEAMRRLGVAESRIVFLGYPDGHVARLGDAPLGPLPRRTEAGECGRGDTTYASRGAPRSDVGTWRRGRPSRFVRGDAIEDLAFVLDRDRPRDVYLPHPIDDHPDHASTYLLFRATLEHAGGAPPRLHRALVHAGPCWPNGSGSSEPCPPEAESIGTPFPPLPAPLEAYAPGERIASSDGGARTLEAIAAYRSQLHTEAPRDWLGTFARSDAVYWPEDLVPDPRHEGWLVRAPEPGAAAVEVAWTSSGSELRVAVVLARGRIDVELAEHGTELRVAAGHVTRAMPIASWGAAGAAWTLRLDPRPAEGVHEITVRRAGSPLVVVVSPSRELDGSVTDVTVTGAAHLDGVLRARD